MPVQLRGKVSFKVHLFSCFYRRIYVADFGKEGGGRDLHYILSSTEKVYPAILNIVI